MKLFTLFIIGFLQSATVYADQTRLDIFSSLNGKEIFLNPASNAQISVIPLYVSVWDSSYMLGQIRQFRTQKEVLANELGYEKQLECPRTLSVKGSFNGFSLQITETGKNENRLSTHFEEIFNLDRRNYRDHEPLGSNYRQRRTYFYNRISISDNEIRSVTGIENRQNGILRADTLRRTVFIRRLIGANQIELGIQNFDLSPTTCIYDVR